MKLFERARAKRARDLHPPLPVPPPAPAAAAPHAAATISTPLEAMCAVHVALARTYGEDAPRIWRLSGARVPADWQPDTGHERAVERSARLVARSSVSAPPTPRQRWGTCCPSDPECDHSFLEGEALTRWMDAPITDELALEQES